jgi:hypothetical protein
MCIECGCGMDSVGSASGMMSVEMEESSQHEMSEPKGAMGQDID